MTTVQLQSAAAGPPHASAGAWTRFVAKTVPTTRHTLWLGAIADDGYGRFHDPDYADETAGPGQRSGIVRVSRWIWWAWHGPIPVDLVVMHRCDLPICIRLDCLELGTQADNLRTAARRDRIARHGVGGRIDHADRRGQAAQSRAIRGALRAALGAGIADPRLLDGILDDVVAAGDPRLDQLALFV